MEINKLYERYQKGESDIALAQEANKSVTALWQAFKEAGLLGGTKRRIPKELWAIEYENYLNGKSVELISKELNCRPNTVYNNFVPFGYKTKRQNINHEELYADYEAGMELDEIALKYKRTLSYIRFLIRQKKRADEQLVV